MVPAGHQFCNPMERSIQEVKKIFRNLNERASSSLFNQPNNFMDLLYKIALIENIMSLRPMLSSSSDQYSSIITPRLLYHPFMTSEAVTSSAVDLFHHIFTEVLNNNHLTRSGLRQAIVCYLQSSAKREHGKSSKSSLSPMVGDMVLFCDSKDKRIFGIITEIMKKNQVLIRCIRNRSVTEIAKPRYFWLCCIAQVSGTRISQK